MHANGINIRYLGLVLENLKDLKDRQIVVREMVARALKSMLRYQMREHVIAGLKLVNVMVVDISAKIQRLLDKDKELWEGELLW